MWHYVAYRTFQEGKKLQQEISGWPYSNMTGVLIKGGRSDAEKSIHRGHCGHLPVLGRSLEQASTFGANVALPYFDLGLLASSPVSNAFLPFEPPQLLVFCYDSPRKLTDSGWGTTKAGVSPLICQMLPKVGTISTVPATRCPGQGQCHLRKRRGAQSP